MASIKDIAKLANVSKSTVSRVVANNGIVKPETRKRIESVMKELNYSPNMFAKGMRTNKSQSIGILFPDLANPFFAQWYVILDKIAREKGYLNYICISDPKGETEEARINDLLARSIDGIILFSYTKNEVLWKRLEQINKTTPIICCDSMFGELNVNGVFADGEKGTKEAVKYLYRSGKNKIAYIKGTEEFEVVNKRFQGYTHTLSELNMTINDDWVVEGKFTKKSGYEAAELLLNGIDKPDAIMASTDVMAIGVLEYLTRHNYNVPEDVAVFGFDNLEISSSTTPALSTIGLPIQTLAETTIHQLIRTIEKPESKPIHQVFDCELMLRGSA